VESLIDEVFARLVEIDAAYSTYIATSEVSKIQNGTLSLDQASEELLSILDLAAYAKTITNGYFDISHNGIFDPSGIVKGWAIAQATKILNNAGIDDYIVEIAGDMYASGYFEIGKAWTVGIRAPHEPSKVVKIAALTDMAIATSGTSERGQHIYNPMVEGPIEDILSISVIGPDIIWADIYATAAFARGAAGIEWLETVPDYEGFAILPGMTGVSTSGFGAYLA
jgi:thiamine biosynthesis lipoprotein